MATSFPTDGSSCAQELYAQLLALRPNAEVDAALSRVGASAYGDGYRWFR